MSWVTSSPTSRQLQPSDVVLGDMLREYVDEVLGDELTPAERSVLELRFGLRDDRIWSLSEIGEIPRSEPGTGASDRARSARKAPPTRCPSSTEPIIWRRTEVVRGT